MNISYLYDYLKLINLSSTMNISNQDEYPNLINLYSTMNISYPDEYQKLTENRMETIEYYNIEIIKALLNNKINETQKSKEEEIEYYDSILKNIEDLFTSKNYDISNLENGKDDCIKTEKMTVTFTTTRNQKNNINNI